jgi:hypothetical protein
MSISQGINKIVVFKKQTSLGVVGAATGQIMRRESGAFNLTKSTFENNEIAQHQQSTGITHGLRSVTGSLNGVLSPNTYSTLFGSLLRKVFTATAAQVGKSLTIGPAVSGIYPLTVAAGTLLSGGFKIGDIIRLSVGVLNAANISKNLIITAIASNTDCSVMPVNGVALFPEGPITGCTVTVVGKKSIAPASGHTQEYWAIEEWASDIATGGSRYFTDCVIGSTDIGLPAEGNATVAFNIVGLEASFGNTQVITTPTAETTTSVLTAVNGIVIANGAAVGLITGASIKIDNSAANMGAVVGSDNSPDIQRGRIKVSGQLTVFRQDGAFTQLFDDATLFNIVLVIAEDQTAAANFVSFSMSAVKFSGDTLDDGEKGIVQTMPFMAQLNGSGGAALANDKTIISIQDSLAA